MYYESTLSTYRPVCPDGLSKESVRTLAVWAKPKAIQLGCWFPAIDCRDRHQKQAERGHGANRGQCFVREVNLLVHDSGLVAFRY